LLIQKEMECHPTINLEVSKTSPIHVLHVDDDPSLLEISKVMLLDLDSSFEIDCACCVDEAFEKLAAGHYDVVISDFKMPQKNGLQFLTELREKNNETPFILFTGKSREEVAIQALNLGPDGYINKQGNPETVYGELLHSIRQSVVRKKTEGIIQTQNMILKRLNKSSNSRTKLGEK
jgi:DNA-binding NarL/FixJ family response regulator